MVETKSSSRIQVGAPSMSLSTKQAIQRLPVGPDRRFFPIRNSAPQARCFIANWIKLQAILSQIQTQPQIGRKPLTTPSTERRRGMSDGTWNDISSRQN